MLLQYYVVRVLCCCVIMLSGYYTIATSQQSLFYIHTDYQHITISLSSAYNFTITIYILLYDTD